MLMPWSHSQKALKSLKSLNIDSNAVANSDGYRKAIFALLPNLQFIDDEDRLTHYWLCSERRSGEAREDEESSDEEEGDNDEEQEGKTRQLVPR